jgi:hypothetical protein
MTARTPSLQGRRSVRGAAIPGSFARMPSTGRAPARYVDPVAVGLVALVVYTLHGFDGDLGRDQGTFVYGGQQLADGVPPYAGILNSTGPVVDVVTGIGIRLGSVVGLDSVFAARVTYLAASAVAVGALSVLAREALRSRAAGLVVPAVFLTFAGFLTLATDGPREKTLMVLFIELALLALLRRRWVVAGVVTALATLTWQPVLLTALAAAAVAILTTPGRRPRAAAAFLAGGVAPSALVAALFWVSGHLQVAWWGFVVVNVRYTSQPTILDSWRVLTTGYRYSLVIIVAGWLLTLVLGGRALQRWRATRNDGDRHLLVVGAGALVAGASTCYALNGPPDLFVVLPFAALGAGGALALAVRTLPVSAVRRVTAVVVVLAVAAASAEAVMTRDTGLTAERRQVTGMEAALPAGAIVLSINAPQVLAIMERRNPYPWQLSTSAMAPFLDDHLDGGLSGFARRIAHLRPALIAVGHHSVDDWLRPVLQRSYQRVGSGSHVHWYASDRLGPAVLRRLREI